MKKKKNFLSYDDNWNPTILRWIRPIRASREQFDTIINNKHRLLKIGRRTTDGRRRGEKYYPLDERNYNNNVPTKLVRRPCVRTVPYDTVTPTEETPTVILPRSLRHHRLRQNSSYCTVRKRRHSFRKFHQRTPKFHLHSFRKIQKRFSTAQQWTFGVVGQTLRIARC